MRLGLLAGAAALSLTALSAGSASAQPATPSAKPNILFILVDNLGYGELGVYGGGVTRGAPTPRIDKLASEGLRLTNMNMEAQCTPTRSAGEFEASSKKYPLIAMGTPDPYLPSAAPR